MSSDHAVTQFGFIWGPMAVERTAVFPDHYVLAVKTEHGLELHIYVSKGGRRIRVWHRKVRAGQVVASKEMKSDG